MVGETGFPTRLASLRQNKAFVVAHVYSAVGHLDRQGSDVSAIHLALSVPYDIVDDVGVDGAVMCV